jgi:VWFA-related protein
MKRGLFLSILLSSVLISAAAQNLIVDVNLTVLSVSVEDQSGGPVIDLSAGDFEVVENGDVRPVIHFAREQEPIALGVVVDRSSSIVPMRHEIDDAVSAILESLRPGDETFLMTFAGTGKLKVPWTENSQELLENLRKSRILFGSRFYDVVGQSLKQLATSRMQKKALIVFSDGADHYSRLTFEELIRESVLYGDPIYLLGFNGDDSRTWTEEGRGKIRKQFAELAEATGGKSLFPAGDADYGRFAQDVVNSLSVTYMVGFYTSDPQTQLTDVQVRLRGERLRHSTVRISRVLPL